MIDVFYAKLKPRQRLLFWAAIGFFILAFMDRLILGPILKELKVQEAQIITTKQAMLRNLRILSFRDSILQDYKKYEIYLDSGQKSQEEIISALLHMIESLAKQNQTTISNIQPGDVEENPLYKEYLTRIESEGTLLDLLSFMDALEASDFLFRILRYEFVPKSKSGEIIKANIDVSRVLIAAENINFDHQELRGGDAAGVRLKGTNEMMTDAFMADGIITTDELSQ